ncbi:MAG: LacI family DNA-binding transcriptional regulator [Proteobacteria bacterium]|nr:LacI family DNA-binding transcriptional regulator [Pseudomonadota bacterium]
MTTIHDVAARAEVSTATVSRVLSNPEVVSVPTRRRVLKAIGELNYSPNAAAKSLRTSTTRKLLVTVPDIANPFFSLIIQGIEEAALREGYSVVLGDTHHEADREDRYGEMLLRREVDGLIFLGHSMSRSSKEFMKRHRGRAPIVNGCEYSPSLGVPSAHIDNTAAAAEGMDHLFGLGHRHIGVITGPLVSPLSRDRLRGVMNSARAHDAGRQVAVINGDFSIESGIAAAARLLAQESAPTAIFCFNDEMAIGVLDYARRNGRVVPQDLSVAGFDDIRFARYMTPALTTISQPMLDIGRETVRLLLGILQGKVAKPVSITLPHKLEIRASTAAPARRPGRK